MCKQKIKAKNQRGTKKRERKMVDKTPLKASKLTQDLCKSNLEHSFGQISVILLCDLCLIGGSVKDRGVVVDIIDVNHHCCVVFIQIVWSHQSQFILGKSLDDREVDTKDNDVFSLMMGANNVVGGQTNMVVWAGGRQASHCWQATRNSSAGWLGHRIYCSEHRCTFHPNHK